jgi:glutaredoxin 3
MSIVIWSKYYCNNCDQAKALLDRLGLEYTENKIGDGYTREDLLAQIPQARSMPQILINGQLIGGLTELQQHLTENWSQYVN